MSCAQFLIVCVIFCVCRMRWTALYLFHCANNVYAFQNLAFSKIR